MEIEFDPAKNTANLAKHGIELRFGAEVLEDPAAMLFADERRDYGEPRMRALGEVYGRVYAIVYTEREHRISGIAEPIRRFRMISVRKANDRETKLYRQTATKR